MTPISAVVLTYNEAPNVRACLESVAGWASDIHVVDSGSDDDTIAIARRYTGHVHTHPYVDHASQWRWSFEELHLEHDWVLVLDADNVVSDELKRSIDEALARDEDVAGYYAEHVHMFRNGRVRGLKKHWLRIVRRSRVQVEDELVDFRFVVDGPTRLLRGAIVESNQKELEIDFWIDKHQAFATRMAQEEVLRRAGRLRWEVEPRLLGTADERAVWLKSRWYRLPLFVRPFLYFGYRYFLRGGFLDGRNGFTYHVLQALWFRLVVDLRIQEIERSVAAGRVSVDELGSRTAPTPLGDEG
jgi:glycosyltransferase involved in cell wall biosynthesis